MRTRVWSSLSSNTQKRYLRSGGKQGLSETQVIARYESGANLSQWRGHAHPVGVSEKQWPQLRRLAKRSKWPDDTDIDDLLKAELGKGTDASELAQILQEKHTAQQARKQGDSKPGRALWAKRKPLYAIELYWYHGWN